MNAHQSIAPIVLNDRQEAFCKAIADGCKSASQAYRDAYGATTKGVEANASRLLTIDKVQKRIAQLRAQHVATARVTLPFLTGELLEIASLAKASNQLTAAQAALMGVAKLHGFLVDRVQLDAVIRRPSASPDSPDTMDERAWLERFGPGPGPGPMLDVTPTLQSPTGEGLGLEPQALDLLNEIKALGLEPYEPEP